MNAMEALIYLIGLVLIVGFGYYLYTQQPTTHQQSVPSLEWQFPPTADANASFTVRLIGTNMDGEVVQFQADTQVLTQPCAGNPCPLAFTLSISRPGQYLLKARSSTLTSTRYISITQTTTYCLDSTPEGSCSKQLPLACKNTHLIADCTRCGCPAGEICSTDVCVRPTITLTIQPFQFQPISPAVGVASFSLRNDSPTAVEGIYLAQLTFYASDESVTGMFPQQLRVPTISSHATQSMQFNATLFPNSTHARLELFSVDAAGNKDTSVGISASALFSISSDATPPSPPTQLHTHNANGLTYLDWNPSPSNDVFDYVVYRENFGSTAFTTYSILQETSLTSIPLPSSPQALAYTVRAKDTSGNLSDSPTPITVPGTST